MASGVIHLTDKPDNRNFAPQPATSGNALIDTSGAILFATIPYATEGAVDTHLNFFNAANKLLRAVAGLLPLPSTPPKQVVKHRHWRRCS
jgi:hypothetical protein